MSTLHHTTQSGKRGEAAMQKHQEYLQHSSTASNLTNAGLVSLKIPVSTPNQLKYDNKQITQ